MKILVTEPLHEAGVAYLQNEFDVDIKLGMSPSALLQEIGQYDAVITRSGTPVTADLLAAGGDRLKVVGRAGIGVDNIDIEAATRQGVAVVNSPNGNVRAAAEHTIALIFALARNVPQADRLLREGVWGKNRFMGTEIAGKTLGIIGLGKVGTQVARRALALDMDVIAYDPFVEQGPDVPLVSLDDLLRRSDIVTLHVPKTPITHNMIGEIELELMKESAFLINCARGKVVNEEALYEACRTDMIAGAALDVFEHEPMTASPLLELPNVIMTPHLGGTTHEAMRASAIETVQQVRAILRGDYAPHIVNPEVLNRAVVAPCAINLWEQFGRVVFDCDSTLSEIEGIDELAAMNGVPYEVAEMTRQAMGGDVPFEEVFARRLDLIKPTRKQLDGIGQLYTATLVEDAIPVAAALAHLGIEVRLVSGGYREALLPMADRLGVKHEHVHANDLTFDKEGHYTGFDRDIPLCRTGGKAEVLHSMPKRSTLFIGDGASDIEVTQFVDLFVGYGGIERRGLVHEAAPVYLHGQSLAPLLVMAAGMEGCLKLMEEHHYRHLVIKGMSMLMREGAADYHPEYRPFFNRVHKFCMEGICS
jgi:phosphoserine phosphatase SerB